MAMKPESPIIQPKGAAMNLLRLSLAALLLAPTLTHASLSHATPLASCGETCALPLAMLTPPPARPDHVAQAARLWQAAQD